MKKAKQKPLLAKNIIRLRKEKGWKSALKFSEFAQIPYPTLRDIEAGISGGNDETLALIAKALNCTTDDLHQREPVTMSDLANPDKIDRMIRILEERLPEKIEAGHDLEYVRLKQLPHFAKFTQALAQVEKGEEWRFWVALFFLTKNDSYLNHPDIEQKHRELLFSGLFAHGLSKQRKPRSQKK